MYYSFYYGRGEKTKWKKCLTAHWSRWIQIGCVVNYWSPSKGWRVSISSRAASGGATCFRERIGNGAISMYFWAYPSSPSLLPSLSLALYGRD